LVDSNDAHARAWVDAFTEFGRHVDFSRVRPLIGMGGDKLIPRLTGLPADSPDGKEIAARRAEIFADGYLPTIQPTRGALHLLEFLADERLKLVVASSAQGDELRALLRTIGASKLLERPAAAGDEHRSKPDPDVVHAALEHSGVPALDAV